jgi:hypothetical protein
LHIIFVVDRTPQRMTRSNILCYFRIFIPGPVQLPVVELVHRSIGTAYIDRRSILY